MQTTAIMAISAELVAVVASALGRPATEVGNHLRNLRESGLVSVAGRGASAAQMTADDAVMLLLAIAGSERVKDSVETARKLAALPVIKHRVNWRHKTLDPYQQWMQRPLLVLPQNHTLGDALRCLFGITVLCLGQHSGNSDAQASIRLFNTTPPAFRVRVNYPQYNAHIGAIFTASTWQRRNDAMAKWNQPVRLQLEKRTRNDRIRLTCLHASAAQSDNCVSALLFSGELSCRQSTACHRVCLPCSASPP